MSQNLARLVFSLTIGFFAFFFVWPILQILKGGFIDAEVELLTRSGCRAVHVGERILRVETAVAALLGRLF